MTVGDKQKKFTQMLALLVAWAYENGYELTYGDAWRSTDPLKCPDCAHLHSYQDLLVANGKSKVHNSPHNDRLAVDFNVFITGKLATPDEIRLMGEKWESLGGRWGGRFGDNPATAHIEGWDSGHFQAGD